MQLFPIVLALAVWAFATPPVARAVPHMVQERAACNQDNVLRALLANAADATGFCSTYINIKDVTATVLGTNPPPTPITEYVFRFTHPNYFIHAQPPSRS